MIDDVDTRLRDGLGSVQLPVAPTALRDYLADLGQQPPRPIGADAVPVDRPGPACGGPCRHHRADGRIVPKAFADIQTRGLDNIDLGGAYLTRLWVHKARLRLRPTEWLDGPDCRRLVSGDAGGSSRRLFHPRHDDLPARIREPAAHTRRMRDGRHSTRDRDSGDHRGDPPVPVGPGNPQTIDDRRLSGRIQAARRHPVGLGHRVPRWRALRAGAELAEGRDGRQCRRRVAGT